MELGELISRYRRVAGMTIDELSEASGVPKGTLNKIIAGTTKSPTLDTMKSIAKALGRRLADFDDGVSQKGSAPALSTEALRLAKDYEKLDKWGRKQVRSVADNELERTENDDRFFQDLEFDLPEEKVINVFINPAAAGPALGETGQDCEAYTLTADDPQGAEYGVRVQGDSMEPYFKDGSIAFVNHDQMADGDIGVFCLDGATVIKQWHMDGDVTYLFSLNRERQDCDVVIFPSSGQQLVWQGRVISRLRFEIPVSRLRIRF